MTRRVLLDTTMSLDGGGACTTWPAGGAGEPPIRGVGITHLTFGVGASTSSA